MRAFVILLVAAAGVSAQKRGTDAETQLLQWLDRQAQEQLHRRAAEIRAVTTLAAAESRKEQVRKKVLGLLGGLPDYSGPLNAKVTGQIDKQSYVIEKVVFESLPRFYVTADLYRPNRPGRFPAVLIALGHWEEGKVAEQRTAANLAMKGFVVLAYDPIAQGERMQAYDRRVGGTLGGWSTEEHTQAGGQSLLSGESYARYQIWDSKRAIDYLVSRPDVDGERIGCTGCSGGGALTTYIAALDQRVKVAAPACWLNSYSTLFSGPVGDSEQTLPKFLASGLDQTDYVELFAPKPWLIVSTIEDFFPIEGVRQIFHEARRWYRLYGAQDRLDWAVGPGPHGTPQEQRERIYEWMIRWLKDGQGDDREQPVDMLPPHGLQVTATGQVTSEYGSREVYEVIREGLESRRVSGPPQIPELRNMVRSLIAPAQTRPPECKVIAETRGNEWTSQEIVFETEPGLELRGTLLVPPGGGRKPAMLMVETGSASSALAVSAVRRGSVVLTLVPRGLPYADPHRSFAEEYAMNARALLIGRNLPAMRAYDILQGVNLLAVRPDVDPGVIRAAARGVSGVWLLLAAAVDARLQRVWLDRTPYSLRAALDTPLNRNLHAAVIPGFCLRWDLADLVAAMEGRTVLWTDPTDWMDVVKPLTGNYRYRWLDQGDQPFLQEVLR
jgi:hypothetical protein